MRIPRNLTAWACALVMAVLTLAAAGTAAAHTPPTPTVGEVFGVRAHSDATGGVSVTWTEHAAGPGHAKAAATLGAGGWAWAEPLAPQGPDPDAALPQFVSGRTTAADLAGNRVAVWRTDAEVKAASRAAGLPYGPFQTIGGSEDAGALEFSAALGAGGHVVALWTTKLVEKDPMSQEATFERRQTRAADRLPDGTWSAPYDLGPPDAGREFLPCACGPGPDVRPAVAADPAGNAVAAWVSRLPAPGGSVVLWSARPAGGAWSAPALLAVDAIGVRLAMTPAGEALATWIAGDRLRSATRSAGVFGPAEDVGPAKSVEAASTVPSLTVDASGRALAVWLTSTVRLVAATKAPGGPWSSPTDLTALEKPPTPPDEIGIVERSWPKPSLLHRVRISRQEMRQPACVLRRDGRARRACRAAGAALTFNLTAPGEVRVTVQRRGRGKALRGLRIAAGAGSHRVVVAARPLPPGRYTVRIRVTADDRLPEMAAKQLVVRPV